MAEKFQEIAKAIFAHAASMESTGPTMPIAWPEIAYERPADLKYLELQLFFNLQAWQGVSSGKMDQGLLQVAVIWPKGEGLIKPTQKCQLVATHFAKGTKLYSGGFTVKVTAEPSMGFILEQTDSVKLPVTIPWTA